MIPDTISDIFQPMHDCFYGLDVEIRPKLTPGAGTPGWALAAIHPRWGNRYCRQSVNSQACSHPDKSSQRRHGSPRSHRNRMEQPIPIPPPRVDSSKGPPGCTCAGGQFQPNLNIQAIKKIIHGLENIKNSAGNHLHPFFSFFEWLDAIFKITPSFQPPHLF